MHSFFEWEARCHDQAVCWFVVRVVGCRVCWLTTSDQWSTDRTEAVCWTARQDAWRAAQQVHGLIVIHERHAGPARTYPTKPVSQ